MKDSVDNYEITVIILTYFHEDYIEKAMESILTQDTLLSYEIIVGDDCSKDNTVKIIDNYISQYPNVISKVQHKSNVGTTRNLCDCIAMSRGKYITLLAGDDYFCDSEKLVIQHRWLENNQDYVAVGNVVKGVYSDGENYRFYPHKKTRGKDVMVSKFLKGVFYPVHGLMFRNIFESADSNYVEALTYSRLIEDLPLCIFLLDAGKVHILERAMYAYLLRRKDEISTSRNFNSVSSPLSSYLEHNNLAIKLKKHYNGKYNLNKIQAQYFAGFFLSCVRTKDWNNIVTGLKRTPYSSLFYGFLSQVLISG